MNICFILEHAHPHFGGVETAFHELSKTLVKNGHTATILTSESGGQSNTQVIAGVTYRYFPWNSYFGHPLPKKADIEPFIKDADIIHTTTYTAAPLSSRLAQKYHKPCILTVHEVLNEKWFWVESNPLKALCYYLFEQYVLSQSYSHYHAVSQATKNDMMKNGIPKEKISVVYHGVDEGFKSHDPLSTISDNTQFLYYGRPGKTKGIFILLAAIKQLDTVLPKEYNFRFILSSDPQEERIKFEKAVQSSHLEARITIMNSLGKKELVQAILESYCVIVPSITEGFGFTAAEVSSVGKPLIISDAGSLPEVASGKVLMFKKRNSTDLAKKIQEAIEGRYTSVPEKKFTWERATTEMEKIYNTLLQK